MNDSQSVVPLSAPHDFSDPKVRQKLRDELRAEEWAMHLELMGEARRVLKNLSENPQKSTVADASRLLDLSSKLGRLATASDGDLAPCETDTTTIMVEFKAALQRVYSRRNHETSPPPAGVIDVMAADTSTKPADAALSASNGERVG